MERPGRRAMQAAATRRDIVTAARRLFAASGYAGTSLADIAGEAGVSVQTIYDSVGNKAALVAALNDLLDEEGDVGPLAARIPQETDPRQLLEVAVTITHNICRRCGDIVAAVYESAHAEPELVAVRDESRRRHRAGIAGLVGRLDALGALREGLSRARAADMTAALTDPQVVLTFVAHYGWRWDDWHEWAVDSLARLVLRD